jgi:lysozyme
MKILNIILFGLLLTFFSKNEETKSITPKIDSTYYYDDTIIGIDISRYQGIVHWDKLPKTHFVFIKATEGIKLTDRMFQHNWVSAKKYKIIRGAYHFYRPYVTPYDQFKFFKSVVKLENGDLPPVIDAEAYSKYSIKYKKDLKTFAVLLERHYKVKPIIYCNNPFYKKYFADSFYNNYHFWIANYITKNIDSVAPHWDFWQYTPYGKVSGIIPSVDKNYFRWGYDSLIKICINQ